MIIKVDNGKALTGKGKKVRRLIRTQILGIAKLYIYSTSSNICPKKEFVAATATVGFLPPLMSTIVLLVSQVDRTII